MKQNATCSMICRDYRTSQCKKASIYYYTACCVVTFMYYKSCLLVLLFAVLQVPASS